MKKNLQMYETVKQVIIFAMFCRRVQIPFECYSFTDDALLNNGTEFNKLYSNEILINKTKYNSDVFVYGNNLKVVQHFSTKMTSIDFMTSVRALYSFAFEFSYSSYKNKFISAYSINTAAFEFIKNNPYATGSTPLSDAYVLMPDIIAKFKKATSVQNVNLFVLTDGDSDLPKFSVYNYRCSNLISSKSKKEYMINSLSDIHFGLASLLRDETNIKVIYMFLSNYPIKQIKTAVNYRSQNSDTKELYKNTKLSLIHTNACYNAFRTKGVISLKDCGYNLFIADRPINFRYDAGEDPIKALKLSKQIADHVLALIA
jgi:hypothetical protein